MNRALLYPATLNRSDRQRLVAGALAVLDRVEFADENGGQARREFAVPHLAGMDEVRVEEATLQLVAEGRPMDVAGFTVSPGSGGELGLKLTLAAPARLLEVEFSASPLAGAVPPNVHLVVRPLAADGRAGPPILALPSFTLASPMFAPVLGGLSNPLGGIFRLPRVYGSGWLFQLAVGDEVTKLQPIAFPAAIQRVRIDALPRNVALDLDGPPASALWAHPDVLLPESGGQTVAFVPAAQAALSAALASAQVTLPMALTFRSAAGGNLAITGKSLRARYLARPLGKQATLRLAGAWTPLELSAPGARRPESTLGKLTVRLLGRELNDASPLADERPLGGGARLRGDRLLACAIPVAPRPGEPPGAVVPLSALRLYLEAREAAEAVLQIHPDVAGLPGPAATAPLVVQCAAGGGGWVDFILPQVLPVVSAGAPLWVSLRSNRGELLWHGSNAGELLSSKDRGLTWSAAVTPLAAAQAPLAQIFHTPAASPVPPRVSLRLGANILTADLLAGAAPSGEGAAMEFARADFSLPPALSAQLAVAAGTPRARTTLYLAARQVIDLIFDDLVFTYDPFA